MLCKLVLKKITEVCLTKSTIYYLLSITQPECEYL